MTDVNAIVKLAVDVYKGTVKTDFTKGKDAHTELINALIEANGGSTKIDIRKIRDGECPKIFQIIETIIPALNNEGLKGDEFFMNLVESRNLKLGDEDTFRTDDDITFVVADIASGTQGLRRQRLTGGESITVKTKNKGIKIYEELNLLLAGRVDFNEFVDRVSISYRKNVLNDLFVTFATMFENSPRAYSIKGTANKSEEEVLKLVSDIETDTDKVAIIIGTKPALRKLQAVEMSDKYKDDLYEMGYYGKYFGTACLAVKNRRKAGSTETIFPDDMIWVIAGDAKPIKHVTEGEGLMLMGDPMKNADLSQEFLYMEQYGVGALITDAIGNYEFATA